jgi:deoxyribodipyrimidine photo-lyase
VFGGNAVIDWTTIQSKLQCDMTIPPVAHIQPGTRAGLATLALFVTTKLGIYHDKRNQPQIDACSNMSPYFHFGQVAPQRAALCALNYKAQRKESVDGFFEESVVRRELADNFCLHQPKYDSVEGFSQWARDSLELHASDPREYIYTEQQFEEGRTHDELWNAAQLEMVHAGKMHGFMRMYWAKKILEWTPTPATALAIALKLNDKYELDGRDPNGFVGCAWAIGGIHDMGWAERTVFGKVRFMNYNGCKRKFDIGAYVARVRALVKVATGK